MNCICTQHLFWGGCESVVWQGEAWKVEKRLPLSEGMLICHGNQILFQLFK